MLPLVDYLELLDWTGRQARPGKRGVIPAHLPPILERFGIPAESWLELSLHFGNLFHRVAGCTASVARESARAQRRFRAPGCFLHRACGANDSRRLPACLSAPSFPRRSGAPRPTSARAETFLLL